MALPAIAAGAAAGGRVVARSARSGTPAAPSAPRATLVQRPTRALSTSGKSNPDVQRNGRRSRFVQRRARFVGGKNGGGATETNYRIDTPTMIFMICVAALFDLGQLASKVLYLIGLTLIGAIAGESFGGDAGALIGGAAGAIATAIGVGVVINMLLAEALSWALLLIGFFSLWLWFLLKGVPVLGGQEMPSKFFAMATSVIIEMVPILNAVPSITWWTWRMAMLSRKEDRDKAREKRLRATPVGANAQAETANADMSPQYAYAA